VILATQIPIQQQLKYWLGRNGKDFN
jgi:hypothetical protein